MKAQYFALAFLLMAAGAAQADLFVFTADLSGPAEDPPVASPGTGSATVTFDDVAKTMRVEANFSDLIGNTTAAHIHGPTAVPLAGNAGVATQTPSFSGFPLGVTGGLMDTTFDMTLAGSYSAAYLAANGDDPETAFVALMEQVADGRTYFNIHTSSFGGGEIRGFLVPEPTSTALMLAGALGLGVRRRRR